ncbi:MAG: ABC transporter permease [Bacteroidales bacterium]|nr:ABC transporter permease [Bacteroidales bacterium]MBO7529998.1 ABC transporter permease [Bacteroidales bacterium]MBQ3844182.1 ABC transporter permease [Bacteroidales bacterium]
MKWLRNIIEVWAYEMRCALFDEGVVVFFVIVPLLYPLLYAYLYNNEVVREVPTVVVDNSHSQMSREFVRRVDATGDVEIVSHCADMQEAQQMIHQRDAYCLIYIPKDFEKDIAEMRQTTVELYSDMSGLLYYKAVLSSCTEVSLDMNKEIKASRIPGATEQQISAFQYPIEYKYVPMFNTQSGFASFIIPAVLMLIIQQTMVLGVGMMAGEEREKVRKHIAEPHIIGKRPIEVLFGKSTTIFTIYSIIAVYLVCIVPMIFDLIHIWRWHTLLAFMVPYLLSCIFFSITVSSVAHDRESFIVMFVFMSVPLLFASGISWPASNIPIFWKGFSWLFPSTFGINGFVRISSMGATLADVQYELNALWIQTFAFFVMSYIVYKRTYGKQLWA